MQRDGLSETAARPARTEAGEQRTRYQGAGRRLAAGGLVSPRRPAPVPARAAEVAAAPENARANTPASASENAPEWDPILPHAWAHSRPVEFISRLMCDPPRPDISSGIARARQSRVPQALVTAGGAAVVCTLLLYWGKSRAALLDLDIGRLMQSTQAVQARTALLRTEWQLLDSPDRLRQLADHHLALQPIAPEQYAEQTHLQDHLPGPGAEPAADAEAEPPPQLLAAATMSPAPGSQAEPAPPLTRTPPSMVPGVLPPPAIGPAAPEALAEAEPPRAVQHARPAPTRVAAAAHVDDRPASWRRPVWSAPVVFASPGILRVSARMPAPAATHAAPAPMRLASLARPQLPRWLTEQHAAPRTPVIMSEKPHYLGRPADAAPTPSLAPAPIAAPKLAVASIDRRAEPDSQPQQAALPPLRPTRRYTYSQPSYGRYYPPGYAYQYAGYPYPQQYYQPPQGYYPYSD